MYVLQEDTVSESHSAPSLCFSAHMDPLPLSSIHSCFSPFFASVATRDKPGIPHQVKSKLGEKSNFNFCNSLVPELQAPCLLVLRKRTEVSDINSALCVFITA